MKVQCVLCDKIETIEDDSFMAKRLRNKPITTYMCEECYERISINTKKRLATGKFRFNRPNNEEDDW